jgi:hypothetical protein
MPGVGDRIMVVAAEFPARSNLQDSALSAILASNRLLKSEVL